MGISRISPVELGLTGTTTQSYIFTTFNSNLLKRRQTLKRDTDESQHWDFSTNLSTHDVTDSVEYEQLVLLQMAREVR